MPPQFRKENNICCTALELPYPQMQMQGHLENHFERGIKIRLQNRSASKSIHTEIPA